MRSRGYRQGDVEAMYRLDLECFAGPFQFDREMMLEAVEAPAAIVVVVEDDAAEQMLGFIIVHAERAQGIRCGYVITIDVADRVRRQGIGTAMLREAEVQARKAGLRRMGLHVAVDNPAAILFYEREQYELTGVAKGFYSQARRDALVYRKQF